MDQRKTRRVLDVQIYRLDSFLLISLLLLLTLTGALVFILVSYIPTGSNGHFFVSVPCSQPQYKTIECRKTFICYFQITSLKKWVQCITACRPWEGCETLSNIFISSRGRHFKLTSVKFWYQKSRQNEVRVARISTDVTALSSRDTAWKLKLFLIFHE